MQPTPTDPRQRLMADVIGVAQELAPADFPGDVERCLNQYYRNVALEDLRERDPKDLAAAAVAQLLSGRERTRGKPKVSVFNPTV